ncbi:MAG: MoaD/ThiS family protein [Promethearchaeota archaeon]|jgi:molybdopterin converting factor small subunit
MSITVKLYGELRAKFPHKKYNAGIPYTLELEVDNLITVLDLFKEVHIDDEEVSHIFINGIYSGAGKIVRQGDRVGIFPKRMGLMFKEITQIKSIYVKIVLHDGLKGWNPANAIVDLPEGSTIKSVLNKYRFSKLRNKLEIIVNGTPTHNLDYVLKDWDNIAIFPLQ